MVRQVKVAILGAGTAGLSARQVIAKQTEDYLVFDPGPLGTTCARVGCMPSKSFLHLSQVTEMIRTGLPGIQTAIPIKLDRAKIMEQVRKYRDHFVDGVLKSTAKWQKSHLIQKPAGFLDPKTLLVDGEKISVEKTIVATGSIPKIPKAWKAFRPYLIDTNQFFELTELPKTIGVIGLGPIGLEIGQALANLGIEVFGFDQNQKLAGLSDPDLQKEAVKIFSKQIKLNLEGIELLDFDQTGFNCRAGSNHYHLPKALLAIGRQPNVQNLGLENLGVPLNEKGLPEYDPLTLQVSQLPVFIAGDVNGMRPILHEAADEGRIAGMNVLQKTPNCFTRRVPLQITFCQPNAAIVGQSYVELKQSGIEFCAGTASFHHQGRATLMGVNQGKIKVYAKKSNGQILGAELLAPAGEHLAHLIAWSIACQQSVFDLLQMPFYHPVLEEGLRTALRDATKKLEQKSPFHELSRCEDNPVI